MAPIRRQTPRRRLRPIASGWRQSDAEREIGSDPTLNVERGVGGECRVINRRDTAGRGMAEWIEGTGRSQRSSARAPPGRAGDRLRDAVKGVTEWGGRIRAFKPVMIGRSGILRPETFIRL
jgi:hypothetical protein